MEFSDSEVQEFKTEAYELLEGAEQSLIALDQGASLEAHYNPIFRAFHSIKGAAGMMEIIPLQSHMHQLEGILVNHKEDGVLDKSLIDLFLRGLDACRSLLENRPIDFNYEVSTKPEQTPAPKLAVVSAPEKRATLGRLLVVDDEPDLVDLCVGLLRSHDFEVVGTTRPEEALALARTFLPDTVLTDMSMPGMSGLELLGEIKKVNPDLPVVFVSAHLDKETLFKAIGLGVFGVIEKPFHLVHILETCHNSVRRYQLMQLFNKSMNLLLYQFSDLAEFLRTSGKEDIRETLGREITDILNQRRALRQLKAS